LGQKLAEKLAFFLFKQFKSLIGGGAKAIKLLIQDKKTVKSVLIADKTANYHLSGNTLAGTTSV
jgi:hypothetical protein